MFQAVQTFGFQPSIKGVRSEFSQVLDGRESYVASCLSALGRLQRQQAQAAERAREIQKTQNELWI